jgi:hypothetical protein
MRMNCEKIGGNLGTTYPCSHVRPFPFMSFKTCTAFHVLKKSHGLHCIGERLFDQSEGTYIKLVLSSHLCYGLQVLLNILFLVWLIP